MLLVCLLTPSSTASPALRPAAARRHLLLGSSPQQQLLAPLTFAPSYKVEWFQQRLDHFNAADQRTFQQRYLVNQDKWAEGKGPILLYTGNEGDITWFCNNTVRTLCIV